MAILIVGTYSTKTFDNPQYLKKFRMSRRLSEEICRDKS
jgi:hypothetical protein